MAAGGGVVGPGKRNVAFVGVAELGGLLGLAGSGSVVTRRLSRSISILDLLAEEPLRRGGGGGGGIDAS